MTNRELGCVYRFKDGSLLIIDYKSPLATGWLLTKYGNQIQHSCHYYTDDFDLFVTDAEFIGQQFYVARQDELTGGLYICS